MHEDLVWQEPANSYLVSWRNCQECGHPTPIPSVMSYVHVTCEGCRRANKKEWEEERQRLMCRIVRLESQNYVLSALLDQDYSPD